MQRWPVVLTESWMQHAGWKRAGRAELLGQAAWQVAFTQLSACCTGCQGLADARASPPRTIRVHSVARLPTIIFLMRQSTWPPSGSRLKEKEDRSSKSTHSQ